MSLPLRRCILLAILWSAAALPHPAASATLPRDDLFAFPNDSPSPASARSAAFAFADRWLGDEPYDHAAGALRSEISVSPLLQRVSRQDLRARNTNFDETAAFIDAAGAFIAFAPRSAGWGISVYGSQPVLRREENAFQEGVLLEPVAPAIVRSSTETREWRGGVALAWRLGNFAIGAAPEFTKRSEHLTLQREGANLGGGVEAWDLEGSGAGFVGSARYATPAEQSRPWRVGASARYVPELALEGSSPLAGGGSVATEFVREAAWEGGASIESRLTPQFRVVLGGGGRTAAQWSGIAASNRASSQWALAGEYHDPEASWLVRFGFGRESHPGALESAAGQMGLGLGWVDGDLRYDIGLLHRSLERGDAPTSSDDRVVASITFQVH